MGSANRWSYKAGEKGRNRVRAYEKAGSGIIYLEFYEPDPETGERRRKRISTGHTDREQAKSQADELAARFARDDPEDTAEVTLRELFDNWLRHRTPEVSEREQTHHRKVAELFCRFLGGDLEAKSVNRRDWDRFIRQRRSGAIDARGHPVEEGSRTKVGPRTIARDLETFRAALNWGAQADLLAANPCHGYPLPKESDPRRPRLTQERYEAMLQVAREVDWRFELALILANETGHRIRAIRRLRWSDIDLENGLIRWRGEEDKTDNAHVTPLTGKAAEALRQAREKRAAIGEAWVLPSPTDESEPIARNLARDWWYRAEELAELEHIEGLGWHGLRRKFADEHREVPLTDLASLGGWASQQTLLKCYQEANLDTMRQAQEQRLELRRQGGGG